MVTPWPFHSSRVERCHVSIQDRIWWCQRQSSLFESWTWWLICSTCAKLLVMPLEKFHDVYIYIYYKIWGSNSYFVYSQSGTCNILSFRTWTACLLWESKTGKKLWWLKRRIVHVRFFGFETVHVRKTKCKTHAKKRKMRAKTRKNRANLKSISFANLRLHNLQLFRHKTVVTWYSKVDYHHPMAGLTRGKTLNRGNDLLRSQCIGTPESPVDIGALIQDLCLIIKNAFFIWVSDRLNACSQYRFPRYILYHLFFPRKRKIVLPALKVNSTRPGSGQRLPCAAIQCWNQAVML